MNGTRISAIGVSHHAADLSVREKLALDDQSARLLLRAFHTEPLIEEAMALSTCNRTEIYFVPHPGEEVGAYILNRLRLIKLLPDETDPPGLYRYDGLDAVRHLFRVSAGLDSQIVGEHEILGQVREAYRRAVEERTARFFLNRLMHWAFRVGKRTRSETRLGRGSASIPAAAVELAGRELDSLAGRTVMLIGAGRMGALTAGALLNRSIAGLIVANRDLDRAKELVVRLGTGRPGADKGDSTDSDFDDGQVRCPALLRHRERKSGDECEGAAAPDRSTRALLRAIPLDGLADAVSGADLLICATDAEKYVLRAGELSEALASRSGPVVVIDISVPRNVDPKLGELDGVRLFDLDALDRVVADNLASRRSEIPRAEAIIDEELEKFAKWLDSLEVTATIKLLKRRFELLCSGELARQGRRFDSPGMEKLEPFAAGLCNKILHQPIAFLKKQASEATYSDQLAAVDMIRKMFELDGLEGDG